MDCSPERYKYQVAMRGLEGVQKIMGDQHKVSVGPAKVHLLRPDHHRVTYCRVDSFELNECVTRNPAHVTCKWCARRFAPWYFKLTYVFRIGLGLPLFALAWLGEKANDALFWLRAKTWAPYRK